MSSLEVPDVATRAQPGDVRNQVAIYGSPVANSVSPQIFNHMFRSLGLAHHFYDRELCPTLTTPGTAWHRLVAEPSCMGSCLTMPLKFEVIPLLDGLSVDAAALGSVNTTYFTPSPTDPSKILHLGHNTDQAALYNLLRTLLSGVPSPFPPATPSAFAPSATISQPTAAVMIGGGGAARAAVYALSRLALSPIYIINRDRNETDTLVSQFPTLDVRPLRTVTEATSELKVLRNRGGSIVAGIGAIPSVVPATTAEKEMHEVIQRVLSEPYSFRGAEQKDKNSAALEAPCKRIFVEMAYKPLWTIIRSLANKAGWDTVCGVDVVLEVCFEQLQVWTGIEASKELRAETRAFARRNLMPTKHVKL